MADLYVELAVYPFMFFFCSKTESAIGNGVWHIIKATQNRYWFGAEVGQNNQYVCLEIGHGERSPKGVPVCYVRTGSGTEDLFCKMACTFL